MKRLLMAVYTVLVAIAINPIYAMQTTELYDVKPGKELEINLEAGGSASVRGWDRNNMELKISARRGDLEDYEVEVKESRSGIKIEVTSRRGWRDSDGHLHLDIKIPNRFDIEIHTKGGDIALEDIEGIFEGKTMGGDIDLRGLKGEIGMTTMGGDIDVSDSHLEGRVHTMGGDIQLDQVSGDLKSTTMGGDVAFDNNALESTGEAVRISTMGGDIELASVPNGARVKTMGGDIEIGVAKKFINAGTMGGDIEIRSIDGWVSASTMGGDVTVRMDGDPSEGDRHVELSSKGGDITLSVPGELSMNVDITLAYTKNSRPYSIYSDFELQIEETEKWVSKFGSPRKYIYGKGKINGGQNKIIIETINGKYAIRLTIVLYQRQGNTRIINNLSRATFPMR
jgi:DUF4097 and DUF4098 domain-containing protein YvlB